MRVWGNLVANVERLDDELFKSLQVRAQYTTTTISESDWGVCVVALPCVSPAVPWQRCDV